MSENTNERRAMKKLGILAGVGYLLTIVAANYAISRWGLVPVGFGLMAPAGVYAAGLAFGLRDATQELLGRWWVLALIVAGAGLSWAVGAGRIAVASGVAFGLSELADFAVWTPLRDRNWRVGLVLSNVVGFCFDSVLFLWLAFGSLAFLPGQLVGKAWVTLGSLAVAEVLWRGARKVRPA